MRDEPVYTLGYDIGSSSIKATLLETGSGKTAASAVSPRQELAISAPEPGWAEQEPETWWKHVRQATAMVIREAAVPGERVRAMGISYQMHGLVLVDRELRTLRPAIIWCDSRAVSIGDRAFREMGREACLGCILNSPGNFTASKLRWVREREPDIYRRIYKMMLPGDFIALKMTGEIKTTPSGLSEMTLWDFDRGGPAEMVLDYYDISPELLPAVVPNFSVQGELTAEAAGELGLASGTPVSYRAGDQPNNGFSLRVLEPGDVAATAGTSGVIYGVTALPIYDPRSRVNTFVNVNHSARDPRYGVLMCVNGAGILNRWLRYQLALGSEPLDYEHMNEIASKAPVGSGGLVVLPYGNGAERTLENRNIGCSIHGLDFNLHTGAHLLRAAQEGIVFALNNGLEIMRGLGMEPGTVRAGTGNMFRSRLFGEAFANTTGMSVELYETDGSQGAARGAGLGAGIFGGLDEAFSGLEVVEALEPDARLRPAYLESYERWHGILEGRLS